MLRNSIGDWYIKQEQEFLACLDKEEEKIIKEFKKIYHIMKKRLDEVQVKRLKYLQDQSGDYPQSIQEERFETLQDQKYGNTDYEMF